MTWYLNHCNHGSKTSINEEEEFHPCDEQFHFNLLREQNQFRYDVPTDEMNQTIPGIWMVEVCSDVAAKLAGVRFTKDNIDRETLMTI